MKNKNIAVIAAVLAIGGAAAWYFTQPKDAGPGAAASAERGQGGGPPAVVNVVAAKRRDVPIVLQSNGTVTPVSTVDLHPQTTSLIRKVHVKEGQFVKEGQLMFTLDSRDEEANVDKSRAQVARSAATVADLERQLARSQDLAAQKFIAQSAVDTLRSQVDAARAQLAADRAALKAENVTASYSTIRAPLSGRVGAIDVFPGSLVQIATSLTTITQLNPITVAFTLPESSLSQLLEAQRSGAVKVQAGEAVGNLSFIDNTVDPKSGTIRVKATFENADTRLWPGQYLSTRVAVQTLKDAVVVPQTAIITGAQGAFVYVAEGGKGGGQSARQQPVTRLHSFDGLAAVSGLGGTEQVITEGKQNLRPGGKIRVAGDQGGKSEASTKVATR